MVANKYEDWLSPMNRMVWMKAFKAKETTVTLRDGRKFIIDYDKRPGQIFVKPASGTYVPRGYFDEKKVTNHLWVLETSS